MDFKATNSKMFFNLKVLGFGDVLSQRILAHYKDNEEEVKRVLETDPYVLMRIEGIGFYRADVAARALGIKDEDPRRQRALISKLLQENTSFGHTYLPHFMLRTKLRDNRILEGDDRLQEMIDEGTLVVETGGSGDKAEGGKIYLTQLWHGECKVADAMRTRGQEASRVLSLMETQAVESQVVPDRDQKNGILQALSNNTSILTGGPGTGKTFTVNHLCEVLGRFEGANVAFCAPTGKAAKRLQELTGREAKTIHRLLGAGYIGGWKYNASNKLTEYDLVVCDESSMLDIMLAFRLLSALPLSTKIVFVGDVDQLPPVGPGAFYRDAISSAVVKSTRLQTNHRQGAGSLIAENALRINKGRLDLTFGDDLMFVEANNPISIREKIGNLVKELSQEFDPLREMQIITPQKQTLVGVEELNSLIRKQCNPLARAAEKFSIGDKVMQVVNDYERDIFNGYVGVVRNTKPGKVFVEFFDVDGLVECSANASDLVQSWACTVHKYQGSEIKAGIVIISSAHTFMLNRNLLYTAMTRFKEKCVILGDLPALKKCVVNNKESQRFTLLKERILGLV